MESGLVMQWPGAWEEIPPSIQQALEAELEREVARGHPLYGVGAKAIARRGDRDDVLFAVADSPTVAVVHLSYEAYEEETNVLWPHTAFFGSLSEWKEQETP